MCKILTCIRIAPATTDVQSNIEIPATDWINMEDRTFSELSQALWHIQQAKQSIAKFELCGLGRDKGLREKPIN